MRISSPWDAQLRQYHLSLGDTLVVCGLEGEPLVNALALRPVSVFYTPASVKAAEARGDVALTYIDRFAWEMALVAEK